ncbi:hypothetical protein AB1N83_010269 [Pleurotus pulmonarius]|nr:hypothetical protein EYR36_009043 [Pleurotus pulmonarius]
MPQFVLYIPECQIRVSDRGEVYCPHGRHAVKYLSRTTANRDRYFFTCDGFICGLRYVDYWWGRRRNYGWIWADVLIRELEDAYIDDDLIDIVADLPARLSAQTLAEIQAQSRFSGANPGSNH